MHLLCCRLKSFDRNVEVSFTFGSDEAASGGSQAGYAWNAERSLMLIGGCALDLGFILEPLGNKAWRSAATYMYSLQEYCGSCPLTRIQAQALLEWDRACDIDISEDIALYSLCHDSVVRQDSDGRLAVRLNKGDPGLLGNDDQIFCPALHLSLTYCLVKIQLLLSSLF